MIIYVNFKSGAYNKDYTKPEEMTEDLDWIKEVDEDHKKEINGYCNDRKIENKEGKNSTSNKYDKEKIEKTMTKRDQEWSKIIEDNKIKQEKVRKEREINNTKTLKAYKIK